MLKVGDIHAIRRLHYCQGWSIRAISRELGVSRNVVRSVLRGENDDPVYRSPASAVIR